MSDDTPQTQPAPAEPALKEARVYLLNGQSFGLRVPADPGQFTHWLKEIMADRMICPHPDLVIPMSAVACIISGAVLQAATSGAMLSIPIGHIFDNATEIVVPRGCVDELRKALAAERADDTWSRIVLEHRNDAGVTVYFRWKEKGGLTRDPIDAGFVTSVDAGLDDLIQSAAREFPRHDWQLRRLRVRYDHLLQRGVRVQA